MKTGLLECVRIWKRGKLILRSRGIEYLPSPGEWRERGEKKEGHGGRRVREEQRLQLRGVMAAVCAADPSSLSSSSLPSHLLSSRASLKPHRTHSNTGLTLTPQTPYTPQLPQHTHTLVCISVLLETFQRLSVFLCQKLLYLHCRLKYYILFTINCE